MGDERLRAILTFWEESLPTSGEFSEVDWAVSNCASDIRILLQTGELPSWIPEEARRGWHDPGGVEQPERASVVAGDGRLVLRGVLGYVVRFRPRSGKERGCRY